ncbi:MAG: tRNA (adenosine(37)-N6)-threonylcarbamoyltransferase complex dimerization subunit type 1 TsaB [Natronohydrobacter sp.]|nr:tRNA (adenosine(37)-N6)-threonylcarbamoyltransferase complex dimerization subunit type 1 TsaB [Natronohydrobacter sp.]
MPSDALILGFDTSAAHCAAALLSGDAVLACAYEEMARGQAEALVPMLEQVLRAGGVVWGDLEALAVGVGPGNFTGIRIAVATARGLALALRRPALGVSVFKARAEGLPRPLVVAEDARRGEIYLQGFGTGPEVPCLRRLEQISLAPGIALTGTAAETVAGAGDHPVLAGRYPLAEAIARAGARRLSAGQLSRPAPLYIRAADAAPPSDPPPVLLP